MAVTQMCDRTYVPLKVSQPPFRTRPELPKSIKMHLFRGPRMTFSSLMSRCTFHDVRIFLHEMSHKKYLFLLNAENSWHPQSVQDRCVLNLAGDHSDSFLPGQTGLKVGSVHSVLVRGWWKVVRDSNSGCLQKSQEADICWDVLSPPCPRPIQNHLRLQVDREVVQQRLFGKDPTGDVREGCKTYWRSQT